MRFAAHAQSGAIAFFPPILESTTILSSQGGLVCEASLKRVAVESSDGWQLLLVPHHRGAVSLPVSVRALKDVRHRLAVFRDDTLACDAVFPTSLLLAVREGVRVDLFDGDHVVWRASDRKFCEFSVALRSNDQFTADPSV